MSPPSKRERSVTGLELIVRLARIGRSTAPNKKYAEPPGDAPGGW
jgi:hypothetical protein